MEVGYLMADYDQGAMFDELSLKYERGDGVVQSDKEALHWFLQAANHGNVHARRSAGLFYEFGRGVKPSDKKAAHWYRLAADQGDSGPSSASAASSKGAAASHAIPRKPPRCFDWPRIRASPRRSLNSARHTTRVSACRKTRNAR